MSGPQIVPTRSARMRRDLFDATWWQQLGRRHASTPMGGRVILLAAPVATLWLAALVVVPMFAVGVAAMV